MKERTCERAVVCESVNNQKAANDSQVSKFVFRNVLFVAVPCFNSIFRWNTFTIEINIFWQKMLVDYYFDLGPALDLITHLRSILGIGTSIRRASEEALYSMDFQMAI